MRGALALIGDQEPGPELDGLARSLVAATGRRRPRVVVCAGGRSAADGLTRAAQPPIERFRGLGADVEALVLAGAGDADDVRAAQAIGEADLIWITSGPGGGVLDVLGGSLAGERVRTASEHGVTVVGCGDGATALGERWLDARPRLGPPMRWRPGLGLLGSAAVVPAYDARPEAVRAVAFLLAPRGVAVVGVDRGAALVGRDDAWQVLGSGRVTVWRGRHRERHRSGDVIRLDAAGGPPD